ncbi:MAG: hypothetical protein ABF443_15380 [Acetobacter malorum]|uniref:hypothetical protein n=1 Tax=Acetobacter malorum TaxID=178901 RepID=UPI0039EB1E2D
MSEALTRPRSAVPINAPPAQNEPASMLQVIAGAAANPDCDVQKMQALLDMQDKLIEREARKEFSAAMASACGEIPQVEKNGTVSLGGKGGYKFSKWEDMDRVIRPVLAAHNLRLSFNTRSAEGSNNKIIVGTISHANGLDVSRFSSGPLRPKMVMKEIWNGTSLQGRVQVRGGAFSSEQRSVA